MGQIWLDLLFAHWQVPEAALQRVVPAQLPLDTFEGYPPGSGSPLSSFAVCGYAARPRCRCFRPFPRRTSADGPPAKFEARYRPEGEALPRTPGSLERWLTERYCLYTLNERREIQRGEIHHPPWPLCGAGAAIGANTMASPFGIELSGEPLFHLSARQDVALWPIAP